ncbi:MAG TPA: hypothetical protein VMS76_07820 [Planctomycetota bacterium]|nr:hypothetical protein [Planctomycetota bacterium]
MNSSSASRPASSRRRWTRALPAAGLFALAFAVRLLVLAQVEAYPKLELVRNRLDDQVMFDAWAKSIVAGRPFDYLASGHEFAHWAAASSGVFPVEPLYPYALALAYRVFGFRYDLVRTLQMFGGAVAAVFAYLVARRLVPGWAALACGAAAALYGPLVFYELALLRSSGQVLVVAAALWLLLAAGMPAAVGEGDPERAESSRARRTVLAGAAGGVLGAGVLLGAGLVPFALAAVVWLAAAARKAPSRPARGADYAPALAAAACLLLPLAAVSIVNSARSGRPAFISASGPYNLLLGNLHDAPGNGPTTTPAYDHIKASGPPESIDLLRETALQIARHPADWLRLLGRKVVYLLDPREWPNNLSYDMGRRTVPALRLAFVELWAVLPLALLGMIVGWHRRAELALLYIFVASYSLALLAVFVLARLRLPLVPGLLVFAALGLAWWVRALRERRLVHAGAALAVVAPAIVLLAALPPAHRTTDYEMAAAAHFTLASEREEEGDARAAWRHYGKALALNPAHARAVARVRALAPLAPADEGASERFAAAAALCDRAREHAAERRWEQALDALEEAERLAPASPTVHHYLANVFHETGRRGAALRHLERAVELDPGNDLLRYNLAALRRSSRIAPGAGEVPRPAVRRN